MYYLVTEMETGDQFACKANNKWKALAKAMTFWYECDDCEIIGDVNIEEISKERFMRIKKD